MKTTFEEVVCPMCNSDQYEILCKKGQYDIPMNASICKVCGFVYLNPRWTKESYNDFYNNSYDQYFQRVKAEDEKKDLKIAQRIYDNYKIDKDTRLKVLDIGAGFGNNSLKFKEFFKNSTISAIESGKESISYLKSKNINVISNDVDSNWETKGDKFDVIIINYTFEHLLNPNETLSKIHKKLADGGVMYIGTINMDYIDLPITKRFFRFAHTLYFTENNLRFMLEKNGFEIMYLNENDDMNNGIIYAVCKKAKEDTEVKELKSEYEISKNKIQNLLKKETGIFFYIKWKVRYFLSKLKRKLNQTGGKNE